MTRKPLHLICQMSAVMLDRWVMSQTSPSVMLVDFSGSRSGLPFWMKVGPTPIQFASIVAWGRPARLAQRALSLTFAPPKAATELAPFSVDDGARNALAYVP